MKDSKVIRKLRSGGSVSVVCCGSFPSPAVVEMAGQTGFDCIWLDMEHRNYDWTELEGMTLACRATDTEPMVRIVKAGYTSALKPLEAGAAGLMIPHCMSAEEARQWVSWAKYPPRGNRGFDHAHPDADYLMMPLKEYIRRANEETFLVFQIEDRVAVDRVDEIASVDGVDVLFVGPADLSLSYGVPFDFDAIMPAVDRVARAASEHGKCWGIPIGSVEQGKMLMDKGARFLAHGSDIGAIKDGFARFRDLFDRLGV